MTATSKHMSAIVAATLVTLTSAAAHAVTCDATTLPGTVVYVGGSSAAKPMLKQVSATAATLSTPIRIIYFSLGSCTGLTDISTDGKITTAGGGTYWNEASGNAELACDAPSGGALLDVAVSDVFASSCQGVTLKASQKDFTGSVQVFDFIVAKNSKHTSISSEAAFVTYGWGGATNVVDTWNDVSYIFKRDPLSSGSYAMTSSLLGLLPTKMKGTIPGAGKTPDILAAVFAANNTKPDASIGVVSADYGDANRVGASTTPVKILAYQDKGAACGFYPDSTSHTFDKINVRTGLYPFWGPLHYITNVDVDAGSNPSNSYVATLLSFFTRAGLDAANKKKMIDNEVIAYTVPQCAMKVQRTSEVTPGVAASAYDPPEPCGCYYEAAATGASSCKACVDNTPCGSGTCRYGYCEAK